MPLDQTQPRWTAASTAEAFASLRASAATERDEKVRGPDELASKFVALGPRLTALSKIPLLCRLGPFFSERVVPGAYFYEIARVKHMDSVLREELADGLGQLVLLGAGFDTRAYRFADLLAGIRVFEVDHPLTATLKKERVRKIFGRLPDHVAYVEVDFDQDDTAERLAQSGYDEEVKTLFIWSGVAMYLSEEGVDSVLAIVRDFSPPGSSIVFDYLYREVLEGHSGYHGAEQARRRTTELGEPWIFGIPEGTVAQFLASRGLDLVSDLGPKELSDRYLVRTDGKLHGRPYGFVGIAHARVPSIHRV